MRRALAVLSAILLVGAFALATMLPPDLPLEQALAMVDKELPAQLHAAIVHHGPLWMWDQVAVPFLVRPSWLLPGGLGMVVAAIALTSTSNGTSSSWRRRS
jgi:hypothetical protein